MHYIFETEHQFRYLCEYLANKNSHYGSRFNYASCELWLCQEACQIINFGDRNYHLNPEIPFFCYNEDKKRDLSFYTIDDKGEPKLISHIEVKLIYPTSISDKTSKIKELVDKLMNAKNANSIKSGWIFLIWTNNYKEDCEKFFTDTSTLIDSVQASNEISI
ncbi:hypothetical protein AB7441_23730, partial [Providencia rettgeri]